MEVQNLKINVEQTPSDKLDDVIILRIKRSDKEAFYAKAGKHAADLLRQAVTQITNQLEATPNHKPAEV